MKKSGASTIRLISWNVNRRIGEGLEKQLEAIRNRNPDIVALQEVTMKTIESFREGFFQLGFKYIVNSFENVPNKSLLKGRRRYGEIVASHWPLRRLPPFSIHWKERVLSVIVSGDAGKFELHTTHIPCGSSKPAERKIETLQGIYKHLASTSNRSRILCGDLNTPQAEKSDGNVITWGQHERGDEIITDDKWWDQGERDVLVGLADFDLADVFRTLYGYQQNEFSWQVKRKGHVVSRRRFDHVFASNSLNPIKCLYLHSFREQGFSDHSPIEVLFKPR